MSLFISFENNLFGLEKLKLPTRYYYFKGDENYIKLLNIGEGIFPKDRVKTKINLGNSSLVLTSESATKIYPSKKEFALNSFLITLKNNSNLEFINDELILFKDSRYIQLFRLNFDESSTFFYTDILSRGRSFEDFDFDSMVVKNAFYCQNNLEYLEKFDILGDELKDYVKRKNSENFIFAKIYLKTKNNGQFLDSLYLANFESFTYSMGKKMVIGVLSSNNMFDLKSKIFEVWEIYRKTLNKTKFNLGKQ